MAHTNTIFLCKFYPFNDSSNVFYTGVKQDTDNFVMSFCKPQIIYNGNNSNDANVFTNLASINITSGSVRIPLPYRDSMHFNYMKIINDQKPNEVYYCFINSFEWSSNLKSCTLNFSIDYFNTYFHRVTFLQSFIEREIVADDTFGKHILPEPLSVHDYVCTSTSTVGKSDYVYGICISDTSSFQYSDKNDPMGAAEDIPNTVAYTNMLRSSAVLYTQNAFAMGQVIDILVKHNQIDSIVGVYQFPKLAIPSYCDKLMVSPKNPTDFLMNEVVHFLSNVELTPKRTETTIARPEEFNYKDSKKYVPVNKKCFCYPFSFFTVTNNNGQSVTGKFEKMNDNATCTLRMYYNPMENGRGLAFLKDYDGINKNLDYSVPSITNPETPFITNQYTQYVASNQYSIANARDYIEKDYNFANSKADLGYYSEGINRILSVGGNFANSKSSIGNSTGNMIGMGNTFVSYLGGSAERKYNYAKTKAAFESSLNDVATKGDVQHGTVPNDALLLVDECAYRIQFYAPEIEEIKAIDSYFSRYGYKVSKFEVPNLFIRQNFDYKVIPECNIKADIPSDAINFIKSMFQDGLTIWHISNTIYDYTKSNPVR